MDINNNTLRAASLTIIYNTARRVRRLESMGPGREGRIFRQNNITRHSGDTLEYSTRERFATAGFPRFCHVSPCACTAPARNAYVTIAT